jgi:hypothetical protein
MSRVGLEYWFENQTEAPSLPRSYPASSVLRASPPSHTAWPVSRELPVDPNRNHRWDFPCCAWSPLRTCRRQYPGRSDGTCSLVQFHSLRPSHELWAGRLLHHYFRGQLSVHSRYGLHARQVAFSDPLHQRLQQSRCLHRCSDCYRVERTSSRAGIPPLWTSAFTAHQSRSVRRSERSGLLERTLYRLIRVFPYRCDKCDHRFYDFSARQN